MSRNKHRTHIVSRAILAINIIVAVGLLPPASGAREYATPEKQRPAGPPLCQVNNLTVEMPKEVLPLRVVSNSYIARENSVGVLTLNNGFPQSIQEIALVLEYLDSKGRRIFATAFAATVNPLISPMWFSSNLPSQYSIVQWKTSVASGATLSIGATSGLTSAVCPAQARATLLHIKFQNGKSLDWSAPDWELPVQPEAIPGNLQLDAPSPASLPQEFLVRVHVPAPNGALIPSAQIQLLTGKSGPFFDEIRDQMRDWRYWFELRGGRAVDGDVLLLVRVHSASERADENTLLLKASDVSQTLGIVDLIPQKQTGQWAVFYGGANLADNSPAQTQQ